MNQSSFVWKVLKMYQRLETSPSYVFWDELKSIFEIIYNLS